MEIIIHQAILHVLDTTLDAPVLSGSCMEPTAEKMAYLQYHIEKLEYKVKYKSSSNSFRDVEKRTFTGGYGSKVILKPIEATIYVKKEDYNKASGLIKFL